MKRTQTATLVTILCLAAVLAGCQKPMQPTEPTVARITVDSSERYDALWETVGDVLREHFFQLDRRDRSAGLITTLPETTAAGFEFWRPQPTDPYYWWEAKLHTIQRRVTVNLDAAQDSSTYDVNVQVDRLRYRLEERQITNAGAAMRLYSSEAPTFGGASDTPSETARWIALGRDEPMEKQLLATILDRFGVTGQPPEFVTEDDTKASPPTEATETPEPSNRDTRGFTVPIPN